MKQLWHKICIALVYLETKESITKNMATNQFKKWFKYLLVCKWRYLSLESFTVSTFSQFNPWVDNHATWCVFCILLTLSLPVYQNAHANSVCDKRFSIRSLFYFQCSTVNIHKYKGECVLRIPHASDGLKLWSFHYFE